MVLTWKNLDLKTKTKTCGLKIRAMNNVLKTSSVALETKKKDNRQ